MKAELPSLYDARYVIQRFIASVEFHNSAASQVGRFGRQAHESWECELASIYRYHRGNDASSKLDSFPSFRDAAPKSRIIIGTAHAFRPRDSGFVFAILTCTLKRSRCLPVSQRLPTLLQKCPKTSILVKENKISSFFLNAFGYAC